MLSNHEITPLHRPVLILPALATVARPRPGHGTPPVISTSPARIVDGLTGLLPLLIPAYLSAAAAHALLLLHITLPSAGVPQIQLQLPANWTRPVTAHLQTSTSLATVAWSTLASKPAGGPWSAPGPGLPQPNPSGGFLYTPAATGLRQFYRLAFTLD